MLFGLSYFFPSLPSTLFLPSLAAYRGRIDIRLFNFASGGLFLVLTVYFLV